ncbi:uncharacterized protein LOC110453664 [Mizuhopecten yessoensis]|uniref:Matrix-remodeling-associated protein 7 helical domain-containing protein n=1 Tax=Mizuhopecten yessoensis TaxID=6573 RepID=A0A210QGU3_MIZYE|nr:uncharacterized protein LOC110453664 [Mizuhopecten yessoensis]OWF47980.1 hypothetical protein KP79_PYT05435 [Mizuhopecten yessoensis]
MDIFGINVSLLNAITVVLTVVVLLASTVYTFRNIMRIWRKGQPNPITDDDTKMQGEDDVASPAPAAARTDGISDNPVSTTGAVNLDDIDPVEYCEHIQSEVKKAKQRVTTKKIVEELTPEQVQNEREIQHQQLQNIFRLMQTQSDKFGVNSIDEVQQQMKLYA